MGQSSVSNMQFPTEAWQSANQSANNMYLQGKKALAEGVTKGTEGITGYLKQQKQIKTGNDAAIKFMESPQGAQMLGLAPEQTQMFKEISANMGTEEKSKAIQMFLQQASMAQTQKQKLEQINAEAESSFGVKRRLMELEKSMTPAQIPLEDPFNFGNTPATQPQVAAELKLPAESAPTVATFPDTLTGGAMQSSGGVPPNAGPFVESDLALIGNNQPEGSISFGGTQTLTQQSPVATYAPPVQPQPQPQPTQQEQPALVFPADAYATRRTEQQDKEVKAQQAIGRNVQRLPSNRGASYLSAAEKELKSRFPELPPSFLDYNKELRIRAEKSAAESNDLIKGVIGLKDIDALFDLPAPEGIPEAAWKESIQTTVLSRAQDINNSFGNPNALNDRERSNLIGQLNEKIYNFSNLNRVGRKFKGSDVDGFRRTIRGMGNTLLNKTRQFHNDIARQANPEIAERLVPVAGLEPFPGDTRVLPLITRASGPDLKRAAQLEQERRGKKSEGSAPATAPASAPSRPMPQSNSIYTIRPSAK